MNVIETNLVVQSLKEKTKAKQRYLRRKKERRKHRPTQKAKDNESDSESEDDAMDTGMTATQSQLAIDSNANASSSVVATTSKKRSRSEESIETPTEDDPMDSGESGPSIATSAVTLEYPVSLPSFPLPALPNAPSKSQLALQGLDQALIDAELVLPSAISPIPIGKDDDGTRLSERMRKRLRDFGITELFAVQTALLPFLLPKSSNSLYCPFNPPRDVCVSAPTGSGKTLAYVLPIIEALSSRIITRLRALIVLPTRDLVSQVRETMEALSKGTKLKIGTATGQHSFAHEQSQLVQDQTASLQGGSSKVDILICTPGRLIDHIVGTPNFSLQHLRFLVIDEADRLLAQSFQGWLMQVLAGTRPHPPNSSETERPLGGGISTYSSNITTPDGISPSFIDRSFGTSLPSFFLEKKTSSCQKLLFSATLTRDPAKITALELNDPKYFIVQGGGEDLSKDSVVLDVVMERFSMPSTLKEHMIVMESTQKPLAFFHLVHQLNVTNALVFTKSAESTIRLVRLFDFFEAERARNLNVAPLIVRSYSSDLLAQERKTILEQFKNQKIHILVCSDLISRGIDISHVSNVVSYDVPVDMRKYVHRVGRTARAGREGNAWTLVEEQEARYFKQMLKEADHLAKVTRVRLGEKDFAPMSLYYEAALNGLKDLYARQN